MTDFLKTKRLTIRFTEPSHYGHLERYEVYRPDKVNKR